MYAVFMALAHLGCGEAKRVNTGNIQYEQNTRQQQPENPEAGKPEQETIETRFPMPQGYTRAVVKKNSYGEYLRSLPLKPAGTKVKYYDGREKASANIYTAVVDLPIGKKNLHQCADAIMRLRAAYFYDKQQYDSIHFNFTNGFRAEYALWRQGKRIVVNDNEVRWEDRTSPSVSSDSFWQYLEMVFMYAGTLSLAQELKPVAIEEVAIGDVFIQGGSPGHAVVVVDMATHPATKRKIALLAQSYMPAQELQVLQNPVHSELSPWYEISSTTEHVVTPEWVFEPSDLMRF